MIAVVDARTHQQSIVVAATAQQVYDLVSDVTRTGEWSPVCRWCRWDDGDGPRVGAHFTGHNETPERTWESRSEVVVAQPGREFAWEVNGGWVRWGYTMNDVDGGVELTESWEFRPQGMAGFVERYGDAAPEQIEERTRTAHAGIAVTLAAIKRIAEAAAR